MASSIVKSASVNSITNTLVLKIIITIEKYALNVAMRSMSKMQRLRIPAYAKNQAREGLRERRELPKSRRFGLDREQARREGVYSGVERARNILRKRSLSLQEAKRVSAFSRFLNKKSERAEGAIKLWGGRRFIKRAKSFVKEQSR